jgi:disulfide bond formation protein DsbB
MSSLIERAGHRRRALNALGALACAALLAIAYFYFERRLGLEPCPLCMFQRVGVGVLGAVFLLAALQNPRGFGARGYAGALALAALATLGVSVRHIYVQHAPPGTIPSCGAPLDAMLHMFPITQVIVKVLRGGGECTRIDWSLLGLSMPEWLLIVVLGLGALGVVANAALLRDPSVPRFVR